MELVVKLDKPYNFEGEEHTEVDLAGLKSLTGTDVEKAEKMIVGSVKANQATELSGAYCFAMASIASNKPIEYFHKMSLRDSLSVKGLVQNFLFGEESEVVTED
jgi:hypothetical protein